MISRQHMGPEGMFSRWTTSVLLLFIFTFFSCTNLEPRSREKPLASVFEENLYLSEIHNIFPANVSDQDSLQILENYIDKWIKKQLILQKA